jgi:hypothetical protein
MAYGWIMECNGGMGINKINEWMDGLANILMI